jgi:hypothetical protein
MESNLPIEKGFTIVAYTDSPILIMTNFVDSVEMLAAYIYTRSPENTRRVFDTELRVHYATSNAYESVVTELEELGWVVENMHEKS